MRLGSYDVLEEIGAGGMAVVYRALQPSLGRLVAIKVLRAEYVHDAQIATRFEREAAALATLQHGNIVHVYDFVRETNQAYIVMEYVEGIDLFDILSEARRIPPDVAVLIARGVAEGLEHAHHRGLVHRDIKPSNILVSKKGEVKVMDFGIARDPGKSGLTQVGLAVGTPAYMAPEQIRGDTIDPRTDIFALGIVLYEMLSGSKPWPEEEGRSVTVKVLDEPMRPLRDVVPEVPAGLEAIVDRCLKKNLQERYASTHQVTAALDAYIQQHVPVDPRARLLVYLRNRKLITDDEAATTVGPDLLAEAAVMRRDAGIPPPPARHLLSPVVRACVAAVALIGAVVALAAWGPLADPPRPRPAVVLSERLAGRPEARAAGELPVAGAGAANQAVGYVRVVVEPWANVEVDGEYIDTTPFAHAILLEPGDHTISFRNPYFQSIDRVVTVRAGETRILKVQLQPLASEQP